MSNADNDDLHEDQAGSERPMSCREVRDLLIPWLDGELSPDELSSDKLSSDKISSDDAPRVSGHVAGCSVCQRELELHRRVASTLDALYAARPPVGHDMTLRVRRRLELDRRTTARRIVLGVAASILIAFGSWWMVSGPSGDPGGDGEDAPVAIGVPAEEELLENLDVLEDLDEEGIDLTPELVQVLLDEDGAFDDDELDEIFEYVLEEEVLSDQL